MNVVFVCTGNTCRSPMACGYLASLNIKNLNVSSAGFSVSGMPASENAVKAMALSGVDISAHLSKTFSQKDAKADKIICMTSAHKTALENMGVSPEKITVLGGGIPDPYGLPLEAYIGCKNSIIKGINRMLFNGFFTGFSVSLCGKSDLKQLAEIESECFTLPWSENALLESFDNSTVFAAVRKGDNAVGYAGLTVVCGEGYITNVAVKSDFRKKGLGDLLMIYITEYAKEHNLEFVSLEVRESNTAAVSLYGKHGFKKEGLRKSFYENPREDAIIMTRRFSL